MATQQTLIPDVPSLDAVVEKVERAGVLDSAEIAILREAVQPKLASKRETKGWQHLIGVWRRAFEDATSARAPRLTDNEVRSLRTAIKRVGSVETAAELVKRFFGWRQSNEYRAAVPPTPIAFIKHLPSVQEFAAAGRREQLQRDREAARRRRADEEHQRRVHDNPVDPRQVRDFVAQLAGPKDFSARLMQQDMAARQNLADSCLEMATRIEE